MNTNAIDFSDLDSLDEAPVRQASVNASPCPKCKGSGTFYGFYQGAMGPCFYCNGTGKVTAQMIKRKEAAQKGKVTAANNLAAKIKAWCEANEAEAAWLHAAAARGFNIAASMLDGLNKYGSVTVNQLAAIQRMMLADQERAAARKVAAAASAIAVSAESVNALKGSLDKALAGGLKAPKLIIGDYKFKLAKASGKNPGAIYVTASGEYMGKITDAGFNPVRECGTADREEISKIMVDPLAAAVLHGKTTGQCSCCGRELTDPVSIERGIGPICESKYF